MIKKIVIASILGTLALTNYAAASTTEVWTSLTIKGKLSNNTSLKIKEEFRFSNLNDPKLKSQRTEVVIGWKINNIITAIGGYKNTSEGEQRPYIGAKISLLKSKLKIDNLTRFELRNFDTFRSRTRMIMSASVLDMRAFLWEEIFVDQTGIIGNRLSLGLKHKLNKVFNIGAYYLLNSAKERLSVHTHILGITFGISL